MQPSDAFCDVLFERGVQNLEEEDYPAAIEAFSEHIQLRPRHEGAYGNRGVAYLYLGEDERAIEDFRKVMELNPEDAMAHALTAEALRNLGRDEEALAEAVRALELDETAPEAYMVRAWFFARGRQYRQAVEDLERYVELVDEPGELGDLRDACRVLAAPEPVDENGTVLDTIEAQDMYLADRGLCFWFDYNEEYEEQGYPCPYWHCIRSMPRRGVNTPITCPLWSYQCPGGEEQVEACRENPPQVDD